MTVHRWLNRRLLQFSLRTFLAVLTIACVWLGSKVEKVRTQRKIARMVTHDGGQVAYDYEYPLNGAAPRSPPGPKWLRLLLGDDYFADLVFVEFKNGADSEVRLVAKLPTLRHLSLRAGIRDVSLESICELSNLETLEMFGAHLSGDGFGRLAKLHNLRTLAIHNQALSEDHARNIGRLVQLTSLSLSDSRIGSEPMEHLKNLTHLTSLDLSSTNVGDKGLKPLYGLKALRSIDLERSMVSSQGIKELQAALPDMQLVVGKGVF